MKMIKMTLLAASLAVVGFAGQAQAQSMTETFQVSITVEGTCTALTASDINFGSASIGEVDQTGSISVRCSTAHPYSLQLDGGNSGDSHARRMERPDQGRGVVNYQLSAVSHGGPVWGDVQRSDLVYGTGAGLNTDRVHVVYGRATLTGQEQVGDYSDTITATLSF